MLPPVLVLRILVGHRVDPANVGGSRFITEGMADYLRLGFYAGDRELAMEQVRVGAIRDTFSFVLAGRPDRILLDPGYLLLDANREDGVWRE